MERLMHHAYGIGPDGPFHLLLTAEELIILEKVTKTREGKRQEIESQVVTLVGNWDFNDELNEDGYIQLEMNI